MLASNHETVTLGSVIHRVLISRAAQKDLKSVPDYIKDHLLVWIETVEADGLELVRKVPGYHDEPLKGDRKGQRSIRLSRAYRAIYRVLEDGGIEFVSVEEVNKHRY